MLFTQTKKDGKKARFLVNWITRNLKTQKDEMPMPIINQIIDWLASKRFKSKPDLTDGYHNIRHHPDSVKHAIFSCHRGKFDSLVIQQVDCNAPATMMRVMNWLLREFIGKTVFFFFFFEVYTPNQAKAMRRPGTFDGTFIGRSRPLRKSTTYRLCETRTCCVRMKETRRSDKDIV